jgi:hypothetical protein
MFRVIDRETGSRIGAKLVGGRLRVTVGFDGGDTPTTRRGGLP